MPERRPDLEAFGELLLERRLAAGLKQSDVAAIAGVKGGGNVCIWEQGRSEPRDGPLVRLAAWMGVEVAELAASLPAWAPYLEGDTPGKRIIRARWSHRLTRAELATKARLSRALLTTWENDLSDPSEKAINALHDVLGDVGLARSFSAPAAPIRWRGGKAGVVDRLVPLIPVTNKYVEPYGGSASVLLARPRSKQEVYNDLNGNLTNLFTVLRDEPEELHRRLSLTMPSRREHAHAADVLRDPEAPTVQRAWAYFVLINQGFGGRESTATGNWATKPWEWWKRVAWSGRWHERLAGVAIENEGALQVIDRHDGPDTTFYLDPPYVLSSRKESRVPLYRLEADDTHHEDLVGRLLELRGAAVLSGYDSDMYVPLEDAGWCRDVLVDDELVWRNPRAVELVAA